MSSNSLSKTARIVWWGGLVYLFVHVWAYFDPMVIPSSDYANLGTTLTYIKFPELFQGAGIVSTVYAELRRTAYLYYLVAGWLTTFIHPLQAPKVIGGVLGLATFWLAGGRWQSYRDLLRAIAVTIVFTHLTGSVNPLVGNKRSITLPVLLFAVHPVSNRLIPRLFVTALACSIYPQAGLLLLGYFTIRWLVGRETIDPKPPQWIPPKELIFQGIVFVLALSPLVYDAFISSQPSLGHDMTVPLLERWQVGGQSLWSSWRGWYTVTVVGARTAFFRVPSTFVMFAIFTVMCLASYLATRCNSLNSPNFTVRESVMVLFFTGLALWGLAHLIHPFIHHPFKYTRVVLPLGVILIFCDNAIKMGKNIRRYFASKEPRWQLGGGFLAVLIGVTYLVSLWIFPHVWSRGNTSIYVFWPGVTSGVALIFLAFAILKPSRNTVVSVVVVGLFIFFYPHAFGNYSKGQERYQYLTTYRDFYDRIRTLPTSATIVGPPSYMDWIPVFGRREVFFNMNRRSIVLVCERIKQFRKAYFADKKSRVKTYLLNHPIDFIFIDRAMYRGKAFNGCQDSRRIISESPVLDRTYSESIWKDKERFYLISRKTIFRVLD